MSPTSSVDERPRTEDEVPLWIPIAAIGVAFLASFVVVGALVIETSVAAFSGTTDNSGSSFSAGTVTLTDDDAGSALFSVSGMQPGQVETSCIAVTYAGTVPDPNAVRLYSGGFVDSDALAASLLLTIEEGTGGSFGDCTGFVAGATIETGGTLADFDATHTDYATGAGTWDPASTPETTTYRVTLELSSSVPNSQQGDSVTGLTLNWEVQS